MLPCCVLSVYNSSLFETGSEQFKLTRNQATLVQFFLPDTGGKVRTNLNSYK